MDISYLIEICNTKKGTSLNPYKEEIYNNTSFLPLYASFAQRIWHIRNNLFEIKKCLNDNCSNLARFDKNKCKYVVCSESCIKDYVSQRTKSIVQTKEHKDELKKTMKDFFKNVDKESYIEKRENTNMERYGVKHCMYSDQIKDKMFSTNLKIYGTKIPSQSDIVKDKISLSMLSMDSTNRIDNMKRTNMERYGVDIISKNGDIKKKIRTSFVENNDIEEWKSKIKESLKLVNVEDRTDRSRITNMERYGVDHHTKSQLYIEHNLEKVKTNLAANLGIDYEILKIGSYKIKNLPNKHQIKHLSCDNTFEIPITTLLERYRNGVVVCPICNPYIKPFSESESELLDFIKSIYQGSIISNDRISIYPYELDILLPNENIAIEFNGIYWHNHELKGKMYHQKKLTMCSDIGIRLIQINEYDWCNKKDIIKSILNNTIGNQNLVLYARKLEIKEIFHSQHIVEFIDKNHIQGYTNFSFGFGLYLNDELIQLMTIKKNSHSNYEISRLCTKLNTKVVGGSKRLFKHSKERLISIDAKKLITYSSADYFSGQVYRSFGMDFLYITNPGYAYFNMKEKLSRQQCQKQTLIKQGYPSELSEYAIMKERKFFKVWDAGNYKFEYIIKP